MLVYIDDGDDKELDNSCDDDYNCEESYDYDSQNQSYDYVESDDNYFD